MISPVMAEERDTVRAWETLAERAYDEMYDARGPSSAMACYSRAKDYLTDAIAAARRLGEEATAERLAKRLAHIKAVYRSQFT